MDYNDRHKLSEMMVEMLNILFYDAAPNMCQHLENPENFYLSIPSFLNRHFEEAFQNHTFISGAITAFRGVKIIPAMELEITLFHKDYVLYKEDWMIRKIPLATPRKMQRDWFTEYVIALHEAFSYFENEKDSPELN